MKAWKKILIIAACVIGALLLIACSYLGYVVFSYERIPDMQELTIDRADALDAALVGQDYVIVTQNLGFGAYTQDFTFFMDGGTQSRAESKESVIACITEGAQTVQSLCPDFILFQEVDLDSTRSHHTNQYEMLRKQFATFSGCYAVNYDSAYLAYPFHSPHGASYSSLATFSSVEITSSMRRSFPISTSFSNKSPFTVMFFSSCSIYGSLLS